MEKDDLLIISEIETLLKNEDSMPSIISSVTTFKDYYSNFNDVSTEFLGGTHRKLNLNNGLQNIVRCKIFILHLSIEYRGFTLILVEDVFFVSMRFNKLLRFKNN